MTWPQGLSHSITAVTGGQVRETTEFWEEEVGATARNLLLLPGDLWWLEMCTAAALAENRAAAGSAWTLFKSDFSATCCTLW